MLDAIDVQNGLGQGCCMAPMLFNLYTCLAVERWLANVGGEVDVGIVAHYKYDHRLFRRYIRNALERWLANVGGEVDVCIVTQPSFV